MSDFTYWKKIAAGFLVFVLAMAISFVAYAQEFSFANELSTDVISIDNIFSEEQDTNFGGITENASLEFTSEKVDAGLEIEFTLGTGVGNDTSETKNLNFAFTDFDYYLDFRPVSILTLAFHDNLWMEGSYLPLWDDNAPAGGLGSSGFSLMIEPVEGLRIAATIPIPAIEEGWGGNFINGSADESENDKFNFGFGIDYTFEDLFSIGAKACDIINTESIYFGGFASVKPLQSDDLILRLGFGHHAGVGTMEELDYSENVAISGKNLYNFSIEYYAENFSIIAELAGDTDVDNEDDDFLYDMYIGAGFSYSINDNLAIGLNAQFFLDFASDDKTKPLFGVEPSITYTNENHEFSAGVDFEICDGNLLVKFPLTYTYSF